MEFKNFLFAKKSGYTQRPRKGLECRPNGRSTDFIAPNLATGCQMACAYCYVARHRAFGNPLEQYTNFKEITDSVAHHFDSLDPKTPNQCDPVYWTYDIGESTDCLSPTNINFTKDYINFFQFETKAKPTFATKLATGRNLNSLKKEKMARVRVSLMPQHIADKVEKATSTINKRLESISTLYDMGYEVHVNFSPVIVYKGWVNDYLKLFELLDKSINDQVKAQLKSEVIFLTHNRSLHESNLKWIPEAEDLMWKPEWQEGKTTLRGDTTVLRYRYDMKYKLVDAFREASNKVIPYCQIRYIF